MKRTDQSNDRYASSLSKCTGHFVMVPFIGEIPPMSLRTLKELSSVINSINRLLPYITVTYNINFLFMHQLKFHRDHAQHDIQLTYQSISAISQQRT